MISLRIFAYLRVSTADQTTDNQLHEIVGAGFHIEPHRFTTETISGSVAAMERQGFKKLIDRLEAGDVLIQPPISGHLIDAAFAPLPSANRPEETVTAVWPHPKAAYP